MIRRLARKAIAAFTAWRHARRAERRFPELAALKRAEAERRRKHRPVKDIHQTRRAIIHKALAEEIRREA
jgi:predicted transcriptional regulator